MAYKSFYELLSGTDGLRSLNEANIWCQFIVEYLLDDILLCDIFD